MFDNPATVFFSVVMSVWTVLVIELWKREQSRKQFEWDTIDFEKNVELIRPEFEQKVKYKRKNPVTGVFEPYIPFKLKMIKYMFTFSTVILMVFVFLTNPLV